jgi:hypothetical protein
MYQKGDLIWIPAGTLLTRPRIPGKDDLFSNYHQTTVPCVGLFIGFSGYNSSEIMMGGANWTVDTSLIRHNVYEEVAC